MKTIKQETQVVSEGNSKCNHTFLVKGANEKRSFFEKCLDVVDLEKQDHICERVCFLCGKHEVVTTSISKENPFTFEATLARFSK